MREINAIIIHCSATPNGDERFGVDQLTEMHRKRGFRKIGYHYVITIDGSITEGRGIEEVGAHVAGSNAKSVGVCLIGTNRFTIAQWDSLKVIVEELTRKYPAATVLGHRDYSPDRDGDGQVEPWEWFKTCPGFEVKEWRLSGMDPLWNPFHVLEKA